MRPGRSSGLWALLLATVLAFSLFIYLIVAGPTIGPLFDEASTQAVQDQGYMGQMEMVRDIALIWTPTLFSVGIILYLAAAIQKSESFFGSGPPR